MQDDFIAASAHIEELDPDFADMSIVLETRDYAGLVHTVKFIWLWWYEWLTGDEAGLIFKSEVNLTQLGLIGWLGNPECDKF